LVVGIAEDGDTRIVLLENVEVSGKVGVVEVVVEEADREVDIRVVFCKLVAAVFPESGKESEAVGVCDVAMPPGKCYIV
jgi:hypothetical protein